jgi:transcriptional regulator with XRE-family HTH domain
MSEIIKVTGRQLAAARALVGLDQATLADRANVSIQTLRRMEAAEGVPGGYPNNIAAIRAALESAGIEFIAENGGGAGVRLKKSRRAATKLKKGD